MIDATLILLGGSVDLTRWVGAFDAIQKSFLSCRRIVATSTASIFASLLASGYTLSEIQDRWEKDPILNLVVESRRGRGLFDALHFEAWLRNLLGVKGVRTFGDLARLDTPELKLVAANLDQQEFLTLPDNASELGIAPDQLDVVAAVRASLGMQDVIDPIRIGDHNLMSWIYPGASSVLFGLPRMVRPGTAPVCFYSTPMLRSGWRGQVSRLLSPRYRSILAFDEAMSRTSPPEVSPGLPSIDLKELPYQLKLNSQDVLEAARRETRGNLELLEGAIRRAWKLEEKIVLGDLVVAKKPIGRRTGPYPTDVKAKKPIGRRTGSYETAKAPPVAAEPKPTPEIPPASQPKEAEGPAGPPPGMTIERRISVWVGEGPADVREQLKIGKPSKLNFKVGLPVQSSLVTGPEAEVRPGDVPQEGLKTEWVVTSSTVELAPVTPDTAVTATALNPSLIWTARFSILIPPEGDSETRQLTATPLSTENPSISVAIYAEKELYRQFTVKLAVEGAIAERDAGRVGVATIEDDCIHSAMKHLKLRTSHEWTTPPGTLSILVGPGPAHVIGDVGPESQGGWNRFVDRDTPWFGIPALVAGPIENVRSSAEKFRAKWGQKWEDYLNDIDPDDLAGRLQNFFRDDAVKPYHWPNLPECADPAHHRRWDEVKVSQELRDLAHDGYMLYQAFFPADSELRDWLDSLIPGWRMNISWLPTVGSGWIPDVPWGLMYQVDPKDSPQPIDPLGFFGLRFRVGYTAYRSKAGSKALGRVQDTYATHFFYWGDEPNDPIGAEAAWQKQQFSRWATQVFVPPTPPTLDPKTDLLQKMRAPTPTPAPLLYLFCQCAVGEGNDPVLRFGNSLQPSEIVTRTEMATTHLEDRPLVFANACTTAAGDPYIANLLESNFFSRGCRAYLGTESKVPIQLASRFAYIFFNFFYREGIPEPMAAGEAATQTRLFLWTQFKNIGGLFYTYVNQYELFMADDSELAALRY